MVDTQQWHSFIRTYLNCLRDKQTDEHATDELSYHDPLRDLLENAAATFAPSVTLIHEPERRHSGCSDSICMNVAIAIDAERCTARA